MNTLFTPPGDSGGRSDRGNRHLQLSYAARRARHCIRIMSHNAKMKAVPATVHGEGVWLHSYPLSALRTVRHSPPLKRCGRVGGLAGGHAGRRWADQGGTFYCHTDPSEWPRRSAAASGAAGLVYYSRQLVSSICRFVARKGSSVDASSGALPGRRRASQAGPAVSYDGNSYGKLNIHTRPPHTRHNNINSYVHAWARACACPCEGGGVSGFWGGT